MAEVCRGNVYLTIPEADIDKYMAKGFSVVDEKTGKIIKQSIPTSLDELQKAYSDHEATIKQLNSEIAILKSKLQAQTAGVKTSAAPKGEKKDANEGWDDWEEAEEIDEKPKKSKKSK